MIGKRLKLLRESERKSQQEVCKALNIEQSTLANYEHDKRTPKIDILIKLAEYYHVSADYLLAISDSPGVNKETNDLSLHTFATQLKALLSEDSSLDLNYYAEITHIDTDTLQKYITGKIFPTSYDLCKLVEVLDTTADFLFGRSTIPHPKRDYFSTGGRTDFSSRLNLAMDGKYLEAELADELDISISKIRKLLNSEEMPTPKFLEKISQLLKVSTDYMLGLSDISRMPDSTGMYPFHMEEESISRLQNIIGNDWNTYDAESLGLTYDEFFMMYNYGFIPHISILQNICKHYNISSDYLLNLSDSKISVTVTRDCDEEELLKNWRKLTKHYQQRINGFLADQILQQERDNYMRSSVAADESLKKTGTDNQGK